MLGTLEDTYLQKNANLVPTYLLKQVSNAKVSFILWKLSSVTHGIGWCSLAIPTTLNIIFSVWLDLVFYHPTLLNTNFQFFDN